jgi:beta-1,2-mannosidase
MSSILRRLSKMATSTFFIEPRTRSFVVPRFSPSPLQVGSLAGTSRIGIAWSEDGTTFQHRLTSPVLFPAIDKYNKFEWEGGCEDPRVVETPSGEYVMTYTSYDGTARLCVATSKDLFTWTKHGPAFGKAFGGAYMNAWTKSGSIVVEPQPDGRLVAVKINGSYWMYWGENDLYIATSGDLINWVPVMTDNPEAVYRGRPDHMDLPTNAKKPLSVLTPRRGMFDSELVEPGPPAILRPDGILFIYNSKNKACHENRGHVCSSGESDSTLAPGTYSAGQVLFSRDNPTEVLRRCAVPPLVQSYLRQDQQHFLQTDRTF